MLKDDASKGEATDDGNFKDDFSTGETTDDGTAKTQAAQGNPDYPMSTQYPGRHG